MKRSFAFILIVVMLLSAIPVIPAYAWNKPATFPNGTYGVAAGSPHTLLPLWDNPQFIPEQNPAGRDWRDHMAPFTFDANKHAEGKVTGRLPAMGWNSWNVFGSNNTDATSRAIAESFIRLGMDKVGWQYIVLDDGCYTTTRNAQQELQPNTSRFPNGFASLATYIHSLGLKIGMYNDVGTTTCNGSGSASWGREDIDAMTYAKWDIDYIKYDYCANPWVMSSANSNATVTVASPNIKAIRIVDSDSNTLQQIRALEGTIGPGDMIVPGLGTSVASFADASHAIPGYVNNLTDKRIQDGGQSGDLTFKYKPAASGEYYVQVYYSSTSLGATRSPDDSARWLQMDINGERVFDNKLPATSILGDTSSTALRWTWSAPMKVTLNADNDNTIRLYCTRRSETGMEEYYAFFDGMNKAKLVYPSWDPIFSLCEWNDSQGTKWAWKVGDSWRTTKDISSSWSSMQTQCYNWTVVMDEYAGLDKGWNDPDMLEVGNSGDFARTNWNANESHFNLWAMMNAPLMLGIDLRSVQVGDDMHRIIMNEDVIALNQDPLGVQAKRIVNKNATTSFNPINYSNATDHDDILAKPLANNDVAIIICNFGPATTTRTTSITINEIVNGTAQWGVGIGSKMVDKAAFENAKYFRVNDLGARSKGSFIITKETPISVSLPGRASKTYRISPITENIRDIVLTPQADGSVSGSFTLFEVETESFEANLILAVYDERGLLRDVKIEPITVAGAMSLSTLTTGIVGPKWTVKGFIWDKNCVPVTDAAVYVQPEADKTRLASQISTAEAINPAGYTVASFANLTEVLAAAKAVYAASNPWQSAVDEAVTALQTAISQLVNITELAGQIAAAEAITPADYTVASYANLTSALTAAKAVYTATGPSQAEVNAAVSALRTAITQLAFLPKTLLGQLIATASAINLSGYTPESGANLPGAITAAQAVYDNPASGDAEYNAAIAALQAAINGLVQNYNLTRAAVHTFAEGNIARDPRVQQWATTSSTAYNPTTGAGVDRPGINVSYFSTYGTQENQAIQRINGVRPTTGTTGNYLSWSAPAGANNYIYFILNWSELKTIGAVRCEWWNDSNVTPPTGTARVEWLDGSTWREVTNMRNPAGTAVTNIGSANMGTWNGVTFNEVTTTQLRLKLQRSATNNQLGVGEWEVFGR